MSFEEFYAGRWKRSEYPDWKEWLVKRGIEPDTKAIERGGDNFSFVCWGELADLKLWER